MEVAVAEALNLADVSVRRGTSWILAGVTWRVDEGQRWVVLGPNGAGKSTLLGIAATRVFPTKGSARILGEQLGMTDVFDLRPSIGLVGAGLESAIEPRTRVRDVVMTASWGGTSRGKEAYSGLDESRSVALLELLGVSTLADRRFGTLSDGERKRVQIARALMTDPELLLLDEPAAGLDLGGREDLVRRLSRMAADPMAPTTVLVTHHVEEIPPGTTHALLLRDGRPVSQGPIESIVTSDGLTAAYGTPIRVDRIQGRWIARAAD